MLGITKIAFALVALTASPGKEQDTTHDMQSCFGRVLFGARRS